MRDRIARDAITGELSAIELMADETYKDRASFVAAVPALMQKIHDRYQNILHYDQEILGLAAGRMYDVHWGKLQQMRDSGHPYLVHLVQAGAVGSMLGLLPDSVVTLLYHDIIEDDPDANRSPATISEALNRLTEGFEDSPGIYFFGRKYFNLRDAVKNHVYCLTKKAWHGPVENDYRKFLTMAQQQEPSLSAEVTIDALLNLLQLDSMKAKKGLTAEERQYRFVADKLGYVHKNAIIADEHYSFSLRVGGKLSSLRLELWLEDLAHPIMDSATSPVDKPRRKTYVPEDFL